MDQESTFRQAVPREAPLIMQIIRQAQARMRATGSSQWQDGYPAPGHISADIGRGCGYVLCRPGVRECRAIIAYGAVAFDGEPAYEALEGEWLTDGPYVVVHRMAVADGECGKGDANDTRDSVQSLINAERHTHSAESGHRIIVFVGFVFTEQKNGCKEKRDKDCRNFKYSQKYFHWRLDSTTKAPIRQPFL